jgi:hypothetical protein
MKNQITLSELFNCLNFEVGDKVKHKNTGDHIYTIKSITNNIVATIERPKELWVEFSPRIVVKVSVCMIENLIKI